MLRTVLIFELNSALRKPVCGFVKQSRKSSVVSVTTQHLSEVAKL
jgi:hypothetical protein